MIRSMTGFGKSQIELAGKLVTIEVKCINSKQLDLNLKLPGLFRDKEPDLRALVLQIIERGKVDMAVSFESAGEEAAYTLNKPVILNYYLQLRELIKDLPGEEGTALLPSVLRMPDVLKPEKDEPGAEEYSRFMEAAADALDRADHFRVSEGNILETDIRRRISRIMQLLQDVAPYEEARVTNMRKKIASQIAELLGNMEFDKNRLEQEMIYYLEKLDITEEKVRLNKHCEYFLETLAEEGSNGKKLGFISQEIGREINTLGSKANEVNIQKLVILMKDELEKVKEQLNNIL